MKRGAKSAPRNIKHKIKNTKETGQSITTRTRAKEKTKLNQNKLKERDSKHDNINLNPSIKPKKQSKKMVKPSKISDYLTTTNNDNLNDINLYLKFKENKKTKAKQLDADKKEKTNKRSSQMNKTIRSIDKKNKNIELRPRLIELEEINNQFLASYTNLDYLLAIIEVVNNKEFYNIPFSDKSKYFWEKVIKRKECDKIFGGFKPETLRKYWVLLSKSGNISKLISVINKIKQIEEVSRIKLKTLVDWLSNLFKNNEEEIDIEKSLYSLMFKEVKIKEKESEKENSETKKLKKVPSVKKKPIEEKENKKEGQENRRKKIYRFVLDEDDIEERQKYLCINEIIETFKNIFKHKKYSESFILDALNINSMNIENTFNYLIDPNSNRIFLFI